MEKCKLLVPVEYCGGGDYAVGLLVHSCSSISMNSAIDFDTTSDIDHANFRKEVTNMIQDLYDWIWVGDDEEYSKDYLTLEEAFSKASDPDPEGPSLRCRSEDSDSEENPDQIEGVVVVEITCPDNLAKYLLENKPQPWLFGLRFQVTI